MKKRILILGAAMVALFALAVPTLVMAHSQTSAAAAVYGPFVGASADSGTCGNWANDTYTRTFTIVDPTTVREDFNAASFSTLAGASPGACENGSNNGNTVGASVHGTFSGTEVFTITAGTLTTDPCTSPACRGVGAHTNTAAVIAFLTALYGPSEAYTTQSYDLSYNAGGNGLWRDASSGNLGDITGAPTGPQGPAGPAGPQGATGPTGPSGIPFTHAPCTEKLTGPGQQENLLFCLSGIEPDGSLVYKAAINAAANARIILGTPIASSPSVDWGGRSIIYIEFTSEYHAEYHSPENIVRIYNAVNQRVF